MPSCNNTFFISHLIENSGMLEGSWQMVLLGNDYTPSCNRMVTDAMFPPDAVIARAAFAVSYDKENVCVNIAQDSVTFQGASNSSKHINHVALMTPLGLMAAVYGRDLIQDLVKSSQDGQDLIIMTGEDRSIWGI